MVKKSIRIHTRKIQMDKSISNFETMKTKETKKTHSRSRPRIKDKLQR